MKPADQSIRHRLQALSRCLLGIHKSLLEFQKTIYEQLDGARVTPYGLLHLSLTHPDFAWLRQLSQQALLIDEALDDKNVLLNEFADKIKVEIDALLLNANSNEDFKNRIENASKLNPSLNLQLAELKRLVEQAD